ncbi:MAG: hypothetical protein LJF30_16720 [Acidobacteria bacterium]|nr:hypothetical protein [Acidobacteriota bacterium]
MRLRTPVAVPLLLVALAACRDPDAPRPVSVLPTPTPGGGAPSSGGAASRPLSTRDDPVRDVRPVAPTPPPAPTAPSALPPGAPDPAEAGISDLARVARYVFREMRMGQYVCSFTNPLRDPVSFAFHIEAQGGRMTKVHLAWAAVQHAQDRHRLEPPPPELSGYVECLTPRLQAVVMDPAPADGTYQPEYSYPGVPGGQ